MTRALERIVEKVPSPINRDMLWAEAISGAMQAIPPRGRKGRETPAERMRRLRDLLNKELVAFHNALVVTPYAETDLQSDPETILWNIGIPLTLFPQRDHGFSRIECVVEFSTENDDERTIRVVRLFPEERNEVLATAEMGAKLDLATSAKMGLPAPFPTGIVTGEVAAEIYGKLDAGLFRYEARRMCVQTEIVRGTAARWRLDDVHDRLKVHMESHQLRVVLQVAPKAGIVHAAGYLQAYSKTQWLTHALGGIWRDLGKAVRSFFRRGAPAEAYGEWENIIPSDSSRV